MNPKIKNLRPIQLDLNHKFVKYFTNKILFKFNILTIVNFKIYYIIIFKFKTVSHTSFDQI